MEIVKSVGIVISNYYVGLMILAFMVLAMFLAYRDDHTTMQVIMALIISLYVMNLVFVWGLMPTGNMPADLETMKGFFFAPPSLELQTFGLTGTELQFTQILIMLAGGVVFAVALMLLVWKPED